MTGISAAVVLLSGCAVGPDYRRPEDLRGAYAAGTLPAETLATGGVGGASQRFLYGERLAASWWELFHAEALNTMVRTALKDNFTLAAGQARLREAAAVLQARTGSQYSPDVDAFYGASRQKGSPAAQGLADGKGKPFNLHQASLGFSYVFDVFGGGRRELESLRALVDQERFQTEGLQLSVAANVVTAAVTEAFLREELQAMKDILASQEKQLGSLEKQFALGGVSKVDVLLQKSQVESLRAEIPGVEKLLSQERHALAVLIGKTPDALGTVPEFTLGQLTLPQDLPLTLPSDLARQRPDIRAAEALLQAANARVGVAAADMYPKILLSGSFGSAALTAGTLFDLGTIAWNAASGITQPVFNGGALRAKKRGAEAAYETALANYRQTILLAFRDVADALRAIETDAAALKAQAEALSAAQASLELAQGQFQAGAVSYMTLLNAERQHQLARIACLKAQAARFVDTVQLFQALGGSWK